MMPFVKNASRVILGQTGQMLGSILLLVAVSRAVGPTIRGEFVLITLVPLLGGYLVTLGLPAAVLFETAKHPQNRPQLVGLSLVCSLVAGLLLSMLTPSLVFKGPSGLPSMPQLFLTNTAVVWLIFASWFGYGLKRYIWGGLLRALPLALGAGAIALASTYYVLGVPELYLLWGIPSWLVASISLCTLVRRYGVALPSGRQWRGWLSYGLRSSLAQVSNLMTLRTDQWLLGALGSLSSVGVYSIAASISEIVLLLGRSAGVVVFVGATHRASYRALGRQMIVTVGLACMAALGIGLLAPPVVGAILGPAYDEVGSLTQLLLLGTPGLTVGRLMTNHIAGLGRPGRASLYNAVALTLTVALDVVLIPHAGAVGAAWASVIGYSGGGLVAVIEIIRKSRAETRARQSIVKTGEAEVVTIS